jgi:hypothetical protein
MITPRVIEICRTAASHSGRSTFERIAMPTEKIDYFGFVLPKSNELNFQL